MYNIKEIQEKLQTLSNLKITQADIANALGTTRSNISLRAKNGSIVTISELKKIEKHFNLSLLTPGDIPAQYTEALKIANKGMPINDEFIKLDYYPDVFGSCGHGSFVLSENKESLEIPYKCVKHFSKVKKYSIINAVGDSMTPYIYDKDKLIVEHSDGEQIRDNKIYIFRFYDNLFIKRLVLNLDQIIVKSDNKEYPPRYIERVEADNFQVIGRIVGIVRNEV